MSKKGRRPTSGGAASPDDLDFAKKVLKAREAGPDTVQSSAAKWHAGVSGLLGGVIGSSGVGLRETLGELDVSWAFGAAAFLTASFFLAFVGLYLALRAAGGAPKLTKARDWRDADGHLAASAAVGQLRAARWLTALAITTFFIAMATSWLAPSRVEYATIKAGNGEICGSVEVAGSNLFVTDSDRTVHVFTLADVTSWKKENSCG